MWKHTFAALSAALGLAMAAPAEAGPLTKIGGTKSLNGSSIFSNMNRVFLNPQPLPPRWSASSFFSTKALNPQPLPPRWLFNGLNTKLLNPQPLPPVASSPFRFPQVQPKLTTLR
jgi:hypothetical protein